jgi:hypothetical protein
MLNTQNNITDIFSRIKNIRFLKGNSLSVNVLLLLGITAFILISADLESDLAVQKDEISQVVSVLTDSEDTVGIAPEADMIIEPPLTGVLITEKFSFDYEKPVAIESDRAPPATT